jgi:hypothetical protein
MAEKEIKMPTCGECSQLVKNSAGKYVCGGKQNLCLGGELTPETDAKSCMRFYRKEPKKTEENK